MMKKYVIVLMSVLTLLLSGCGSQNKLAKAEQEAEVARQVEAALDARQYTIAVDWMRSLGGLTRHVNSNYELKVDGNLVDSYLPYVGEVYRMPYGGGKALNFKGEIQNYTISKRTSNRYIIEFDVINDEDAYRYRIDMFTNGKAIIDVLARDRDAISFDGEMKLP